MKEKEEKARNITISSGQQVASKVYMVKFGMWRGTV